MFIEIVIRLFVVLEVVVIIVVKVLGVIEVAGVIRIVVIVGFFSGSHRRLPEGLYEPPEDEPPKKGSASARSHIRIMPHAFHGTVSHIYRIICV